MPELDTAYYPARFVKKDSAAVADEIRIITWEDDRRVVIDENGIGLRSVKRFGSAEGVAVRTPGQVAKTGGDTTTWYLSIDPASYYYAAPLQDATYSALVPSTEYVATLTSEDGSTSLEWTYEVSTGMYTTRLEPDFNTANTYTLTVDGPGNMGTVATVEMQKFLLEDYVFLATMSFEGAWTIGNSVSYYQNNGGLSMYVGDAARVAFVTHPTANSYDEYPFSLWTTYTPQDNPISVIAASQAEEITATFAVGNLQEEGFLATRTYQAQVVDLYSFGSYSFPAGASYQMDFKRTAWAMNNTNWESSLQVFASFPIGIETQYAAP